MSDQERSHARVLRYIAGGSPQGIAGETLATLEGRHRAPGGNSLRAAVLGANDGLTSNLALVMGVAGAQLKTAAILITGLSGLLAGAFSMAIGEWISVQSARELYQRQVKTEAAEIRSVPDEEQEELALIYEAKGLPQEEAQQVAERLMADEQAALDAMVREELGLDPSSARRFPLRRRRLLVPAVLDRRRHPVDPLLHHQRHRRPRCRHRLRRVRAVRHRDPDHAFDRAQGDLLRDSPALLRTARRGSHLRSRATHRYRHRRIGTLRPCVRSFRRRANPVARVTLKATPRRVLAHRASWGHR